jgi:hypothetical protein
MVAVTFCSWKGVTGVYSAAEVVMVDAEGCGDIEVLIERAMGVDRHFLRSISSVQEYGRRSGALCSGSRAHPAVMTVYSVAV